MLEIVSSSEFFFLLDLSAKVLSCEVEPREINLFLQTENCHKIVTFGVLNMTLDTIRLTFFQSGFPEVRCNPIKVNG